MTPKARTLALTIAYDGTQYAGWQRQREGAPGRRTTIQACLERALQQIVRHPVSIIASGRTDAGVHARAQVAHVQCETLLSLPRLRQALNALLPPDIRVTQIRPGAATFHARYSCVAKRYRYAIYNNSVGPVFDRCYVWHITAPLKVALMGQAGAALIGTHDFTSFQATDNVKRSAVRTVTQLRLRTRGRYIFVDIQADGFVYTMVRSIVGTLVEIGRGKIPPHRMRHILKARDRAAAGPTAPARGLTLQHVWYR